MADQESRIIQNLLGQIDALKAKNAALSLDGNPLLDISSRGAPIELTSKQLADFRSQGYLIVPKVYSRAEMTHWKRLIQEDKAMQEKDSQGNNAKTTGISVSNSFHSCERNSLFGVTGVARGHSPKAFPSALMSWADGIRAYTAYRPLRVSVKVA
jgi:hypothetical protein